MSKILIFTPNKSLKGGVSNFYAIAKHHFTDNVICISFNSFTYKGVLKLFVNFMNYILAISKILIYRPRTVVVNPSLGKTPIFRDGLLIYWSKIFNFKTAVFWRGWNPNNEKILEGRILKFLFQNYFKKVDRHIVLNSYVKRFLLDNGVPSNKIKLSTTLVDDSFFTYDEKIKKEKFTVLFLSRIEKYKGIYEALEAYNIFSQDKEVELHIAGVGTELENVKRKVENDNIKGVKILGFIDGDFKKKSFQQADCYLFPSYSEGMPNSVLEAMACGVPVVCTEVGALKDFFQNGKMGFSFSLPIDVNLISRGLEKIYEDINLQQSISLFNKKFAEDNFIASKVVSRLEANLTEID